MVSHFKILFLYLLIFWGSLICAQTPEQKVIDSLKVALINETADTSRVNILNKLSMESYYSSQFDSANYYAQNALKLSQQIGFSKGMGYAYGNVAFVYRAQGKYLEAKEFFIKSKNIFEKIDDKVEVAWALLEAGLMNYNLGNYIEALEYYLQALTFAEKSGNADLSGKISNNIGNVYTNNDDKNKALTYYFKARSLFDKVGNKPDLALATGNIALVYHAQKNFEKALEYDYKALKINEEIGNKQGIARCYLSIGIQQMELKDYDTALANFLKAQELFKQVEDAEFGVYTLVKLGQLYLRKAKEQKGTAKSKQEFLRRAISFLETSTNTYMQLGLLRDLEESSDRLSEAYEANKQYDKALTAYKLYVQTKDSLFNQDNTKELTRVEMNYEFEKKQNITRVENEKEIAIRDATLKANKREKWFLFSGMLGLFIIGTMLFRIGRIRKKSNDKLVNLNSELEAANQIKMRFVAILHHDLRGPVASLIHFLHLKKNNREVLTIETTERLEEKTMTGAENLLETMEDLLLWSKGQMGNFRPHLKQLSVHSIFQHVNSQYLNEERITFCFENPNDLVLLTDEDYLKTILRNLTSNAVKILEDTENPIITWKASKEYSQTILSITDNGRGADDAKFKALFDDSEVVGIKSGMGLHLIRDLAKAIHCKISVHSQIGVGTQIILKLPDGSVVTKAA